jgi:hypothetical protein
MGRGSIEGGSVKTIKLTKGYEAIVDDEDYERSIKIIWHTHLNNGGGGEPYAFGRIKVAGKWKSIMLHRYILGIEDPKTQVDHIDRNPLNNTRSNLRTCTHGQNMANKPLYKNNKSGFKGVFWSRRSRRYLSLIRVNYKMIYLGSFKDPILAAMAYNSAAIKHFKDFANINKIPAEVN